jgi:hypothetical protein
MNEAATETRSVVVEREIPHPPEKIWRALTQPHLAGGRPQGCQVHAPIPDRKTPPFPSAAERFVPPASTGAISSRFGHRQDTVLQRYDIRMAELAPIRPGRSEAGPVRGPATRQWHRVEDSK